MNRKINKIEKPSIDLFNFDTLYTTPYDTLAFLEIMLITLSSIKGKAHDVAQSLSESKIAGAELWKIVITGMFAS